MDNTIELPIDEIVPEPKHVILDSQVLSAVMGCPCYADLRFNHDLVPLGGKSNPLECGSIAHNIMEGYNLGRIKGLVRSDAISEGFALGMKYVKEGDDGLGLKNTPAESSKKPTRIGWKYVFKTMEEYFDFTRNSPHIPLEAEVVKGKLVYSDEDVNIIWKAKFDLIEERLDVGILPVDYKSMSQDRPMIKLNNQFIGQCVLMGSSRMMVRKIGFQTSLKAEEKFTEVIYSYSEDLLKEWTNIILPYYSKLLLFYSESGHWPKNYTKCESKYGFCQFHKICSADRTHREQVIRDSFVKSKKWDIANISEGNSDV